MDVYRGWKMARLTLTLQFVWFTTSLVGYGIILGVSSLAGNVYVNMFLVEAVEIPFIMATSYFSNCIGRRWTALIYFGLATVTAFCAFLFHLIPSMPNKEMSITIMCICCRTFIAGAAAVFIVISTEVYPTVIRTLGYGAANTAAKVGGVLAPFVINMDSIPTVAYTIMFVTCLLCVFAVISLSETKNLLMEDTLEKSTSKLSLMSSRSFSYDQTSTPRRSSSQARIIIDFDTDLIHHRSYSEFEDDDDDGAVGINVVPLVEDAKKSNEKSNLVGRYPRMTYDAFVASGEKNDGVDGLSDSCKGSSPEKGYLTAAVGAAHRPGDKGYSNVAYSEDLEKSPHRKRRMFYMSQSISVENDPGVNKKDDEEGKETSEVTGDTKDLAVVVEGAESTFDTEKGASSRGDRDEDKGKESETKFIKEY